MPEWTSLGWILAIAFMVGFVFMARYIFKMIGKKKEEKEIEKRLAETLGPTENKK